MEDGDGICVGGEERMPVNSVAEGRLGPGDGSRGGGFFELSSGFGFAFGMVIRLVVFGADALT